MTKVVRNKTPGSLLDSPNLQLEWCGAPVFMTSCNGHGTNSYKYSPLGKPRDWHSMQALRSFRHSLTLGTLVVLHSINVAIHGVIIQFCSQSGSMVSKPFGLCLQLRRQKNRFCCIEITFHQVCSPRTWFKQEHRHFLSPSSEHDLFQADNRQFPFNFGLEQLLFPPEEATRTLHPDGVFTLSIRTLPSCWSGQTYRRFSLGLGWPAKVALFLPKSYQKLQNTLAPTVLILERQTNWSRTPWGYFSHLWS